MLIRVYAYGVRVYFQSAFNRYDFVVSFCSSNILSGRSQKQLSSGKKKKNYFRKIGNAPGKMFIVNLLQQKLWAGYIYLFLAMSETFLVDFFVVFGPTFRVPSAALL